MTGFLQEETERFRKALQDIDGDMIKVIKALQEETDGVPRTPSINFTVGPQALH